MSHGRAARLLLTGFVGTLCVGITALMLAGCAGRLVPPDRGAHGNLHAELARGSGRTATVSGPPSVVLIERSGVRAIDPIAGVLQWSHPMHVVAHPVASRDTVYLPIRGHRLAAVDRVSGAVRWSTRLPGEALTGLTVAGNVVVAVVVDGSDRSRSRVVALSTEDAVPRWQRRSDQRFGVPAARARVVVVPLGDEVVAFRLTSGREVARVTLPKTEASVPELERLQTQDDALVLGGGNRFINLLSATGGQAPEPQRIETGYGWLFRPIEGLDPGFDDSERLRLWVRFDVSGLAPRGAVMLARRVVVAMRLAPDGRPIRARWVHHGGDNREFVAMDVGHEFVTLVREDGSIVRLCAKSGAVLKRWAGTQATRGALLLDLDATDAAPKRAAPDEATTYEQLASLLDDDDPRLSPVQTLAADLLWRSDDLTARTVIEEVASGTRTVGYGDSAAQLQAHALTLLSEPWGRADASELNARLAQLSDRPSFLSDRSLQLATVARAAVHSGSAQMVPHLVDHLLHPATQASDLTEVARALATLGGTAATDGLVAFVRRYHADPDVVYESRALYVAVDHLAGLGAGDDAAAGGGATDTLVDAMRDPFTEPDLRAYIAARLVEPVQAATAVAEPAAPPSPSPRDHERIPMLPEVHPPGL